MSDFPFKVGENVLFDGQHVVKIDAVNEDGGIVVLEMKSNRGTNRLTRRIANTRLEPLSSLSADVHAEELEDRLEVSNPGLPLPVEETDEEGQARTNTENVKRKAGRPRKSDATVARETGQTVEAVRADVGLVVLDEDFSNPTLTPEAAAGAEAIAEANEGVVGELG